jgi:hypothetical protein
LSPQSGRLQRVEINLLKHLARFSPFGTPVTVPEKFRPAFVPLWRLGLIEIWYRQDRDSVGGRRTQFISITVDGSRRIDAILNSSSRRLARFQGQEESSDQPSEPKQEQDG